jgi:hypothetical protein
MDEDLPNCIGLEMNQAPFLHFLMSSLVFEARLVIDEVMKLSDHNESLTQGEAAQTLFGRSPSLESKILLHRQQRKPSLNLVDSSSHDLFRKNVACRSNQHFECGNSYVFRPNKGFKWSNNFFVPPSTTTKTVTSDIFESKQVTQSHNLCRNAPIPIVSPFPSPKLLSLTHAPTPAPT